MKQGIITFARDEDREKWELIQTTTNVNMTQGFATVVSLRPTMKDVSQMVSSVALIEVREGQPINEIRPDNHTPGVILQFVKSDQVYVSVCESIEQALDLVRKLSTAILTNCPEVEEALLRAMGEGILNAQNVRAKFDEMPEDIKRMFSELPEPPCPAPPKKD